MRAKKTPEPLQQRGRARQRDTKFFNKPLHLTKPKKKSQGENQHWSRRPKQRERDAAILASLGLDFEAVMGTTFHRLSEIGGHHG